MCGSGITADEKFKKLKNGEVKRYVYYGCTRGRDIDCKCGYMREEKLIEQLSRVLDQIDLNELNIKKQFEEEIERFQKFNRSVLGVLKDSGSENQKEIDIRNYAKYVLKEGSILEKRSLLSNLESRLVMRDKKLKLLQ